MNRNFAGIFLTVLFSTGILVFSVFRSASIKYVFAGPETEPTPKTSIEVIYDLPYEGGIGPDSPFWPLKAGRDKLWLLATPHASKKSELQLLFADKRLKASLSLFRKDKASLGYSTLTKAEKYLQEAYLFAEEARSKGENTDKLLSRISLASLKHIQIGQEILDLAPDDAKPNIIKTLDYPKNIYKDSKNVLVGRGITPPENPFSWE